MDYSKLNDYDTTRVCLEILRPYIAEDAQTTPQGYLTADLERCGFEEVPALGEDFDPEKHNAVMRETTDDPGKVLEVFQKGYRVKDKIIRYAMVKVSVE